MGWVAAVLQKYCSPPDLYEAINNGVVEIESYLQELCHPIKGALGVQQDLAELGGAAVGAAAGCASPVCQFSGMGVQN